MLLQISTTNFLITIISVLAISSIVHIITMSYIYKKRHAQKEKLLKIRVERKINEIERKNVELEKANATKTRLISIISHDIITPLRFMHIIGNKILTNDDTDITSSNMKREILCEIVNTSHELEVLATNILNWIKYQNDNRKPIKETVDIYILIEQVFYIVGGMAKQKSIMLTNDVPKGLIAYQYYEPLRIIIYNLVLNAINFMKGGHITIAAKQIKKGLFIIVKDEGFGMSQQQIDNLLSEDMIVSSVNTSGKRGNGLGYLIIKDLLKLTDGKFSISSAKYKGTKIKLFFSGE